MQKLAVITGGTKGIGRALVKKFAENGFSVSTCARNEEALDQLKEEMEAAHETKIHTFTADLSKKEESTEFVEFNRLISKPLEVLINNTGVFMPGEIMSEPEGALETMINTNLYSAYHITRGLVPLMLQNKGGHVFNMCSIASFMAYANGGSYSISKFAMLGFSKVLREELKDKAIRVTSVMPGATYTPSWEGAGIEEQRLMPAEDIASLVFDTYKLSLRTVVEDIVVRPQLGDL